MVKIPKDQDSRLWIKGCLSRPFRPFLLVLLFGLQIIATPSFAQSQPNKPIRPLSGLPEIDSLPLDDWKVENPPLEYSKAIALGAFLPGGGQFYGGHPVRGGFLVGLEGLLVGLAISTYAVALPKWDREAKLALDSAASAFRRGAVENNAPALADFENQMQIARDKVSLRVRQADLANSQLAWALGLHAYGLLDASEIVRKSRTDTLEKRSVRKAFALGLLFPGAGQLYNHRYGKFGMLWMALGASTLSAWSRQQVVDFYNESIAIARQEPSQAAFLESLERDRTLYRKRRNQYYWGMALFYLYSVMDGMVDAALSDFDAPQRYAVGPGMSPFSLALEINF
jgi:TM2 domain-containing membrane protein YozV